MSLILAAGFVAERSIISLLNISPENTSLRPTGKVCTGCVVWKLQAVNQFSFDMIFKVSAG
jgi:hypothetical protein